MSRHKQVTTFFYNYNIINIVIVKLNDSAPLHQIKIDNYLLWKSSFLFL